MMHLPELMAPAGSFASLNAALNAGADSIYFGIGKLNMRSRAAANFELEDMTEIVSICKKHYAKAYLTLNTIIDDADLDEMREIINQAKKEGIDAVIASDWSVIQYAHSIDLPVHISVQQNISNIEAVRFVSKYADTIVLARELTLPQIKAIADQIVTENICGSSGEFIKIELFAHGALCVARSGTCYMSLSQCNASANRGQCLQMCRRSYTVTDDETGDKLKLENHHVMSPKDLCTIGFLDQLIDGGVSILKLEGRGRSPDYVSTVTGTYRTALDAIGDGSYTKENIDAWTKQLASVFNRGFWHGGYYLGKKMGAWSGQYGSHATQKKIQIGKVLHYYPKAKVAHLIIHSDQLCIGDDILITGDTTGVVATEVTEIFVDDQPSDHADQGQECTIALKEKVRKNDKLFKLCKKA